MSLLHTLPGILSQQAADTGGAFSPDDITNMEGWYDASDPNTLVTSGSSLLEWVDKSSKARHLNTSVSSSRPSSGTRTLNGLNVVDFSGGQNIHSALFASVINQPLTVMALVNADTTANGGRYFDSYNGSVGGRALFYVLSGTWRVQAGTAVNTNRAPTTGVPKLHEVTFNSASSAFRENGVQYGGTFNPGSGGIYRVSVSGDGTSTNNAWDGTVAELLIYRKVLTAQERSDLEAYFADKWGITL